MKGWGAQSSVCPSKTRETKLSGEISQDSCRENIPEVPEKFEQKKFVFNFWALETVVLKWWLSSLVPLPPLYLNLTLHLVGKSFTRAQIAGRVWF